MANGFIRGLPLQLLRSLTYSPSLSVESVLPFVGLACSILFARAFFLSLDDRSRNIDNPKDRLWLIFLSIRFICAGDWWRSKCTSLVKLSGWPGSLSSSLWERKEKKKKKKKKGKGPHFSEPKKRKHFFFILWVMIACPCLLHLSPNSPNVDLRLFVFVRMSECECL